MEMILKENERIDDLEYKGLKIIQNKNAFCFGIDAVLLSHFAKEIKKNSIIVDMCSGTGIIGILLTAKAQPKNVIGIEIQPEMYEMACRSIILNEIEDKMKMLNEDINNIPSIFTKESVDAIVVNPPYKKIRSGKTNNTMQETIARHEIKCNIEDVCRNAKYLLKNNGAMYMIHRPERLHEILYCMKNNNLEAKKLRMVQPNLEKKPNMILIKAVKNAKSFLEIEKNLILYDEKGKYTQEILEIYSRIEGEKDAR